MGGTIELRPAIVVHGLHIRVAHQHGDGRAQAAAFIDAAEHFNLIELFARRNQQVLAWTTALQLALNCLQIDGDAGRTTIDDDANARAMGFAKGADPKENAGL